MKIAFVTNSIYTFGGEQRVVSIIANELSKKHEVTIFTTDPINHTELPYEISDNITVKFFKPFESNIFIKGFRFLLRFSAFEKLKFKTSVQEFCYYNKINAKRLYALLGNEFNIVIGVSGELTMLLGLSHQFGLKSKTLGWEHSSFDAYFRLKNRNFYNFDKLWIKCTKDMTKIVLLNDYYVEQYTQAFNNNCISIYNPRSFVSEQKSPLTDKSFITCCRFEYVKGIDLLLQSFLKFAESNNDWKLKLVGEGIALEECKKIVKEHNLSDRVLFLGKRYDIKELLLDSSVFVLPSRWEGFPMSLTEACETGLPSIFFDIPASIPFAKNNTGIKCPSYDIDSFANAMAELANSEKKRKEISEAAIKFADKLSIENISKQWFDLIESL